MENDKNGLSKTQGSAIIVTVNTGKDLATKHPEIAEYYRSGLTQKNIAELLRIAEEYGISEYIARKAVGRAIMGNEEGLLGLESYVGLIPDRDERKRIALKHFSTAAKRTEARKLGIHSVNPDTGERFQVEGGLRVLELGLGVHSRTTEERSEDGRKGAHASLRAQGRTPFSTEELVYAHVLSQQDSYKLGTKANNTLIAAEVNKRFHDGRNVRNSNTIGSTLCTYRKSLKD